MSKKILVTGASGFIGSHLVKELLKDRNIVIGIDNNNGYYDINLKLGRLQLLGINTEIIKYNKYIQSELFENFRFIKLDICDRVNLENLFSENNFDGVINLAAQPGVRYSLINPLAYIETNILGFFNIIDNCRRFNIDSFVFASSSSVYGLNEKMPYSIHDNVDHPVNIYAATKKSNELIAHSYSHLYNLPITGLRFFTVYGPWGRPDMAYFLFTKSILEGKPIKVFNNGIMERDFTYIDDIVKGIVRVLNKPAKSNKYWSGKNPDPSSSIAPYKLYNIGNNKPVKLMDLINQIEDSLGKKAIIDFQPMQPGDIYNTWADVYELIDDFGYKPDTSINKGISEFVNWYKRYYKIVD